MMGLGIRLRHFGMGQRYLASAHYRGGKNSVARGINDLGQIVGYSDDGSGEYHAVLWTPSPAVPVPLGHSTWPMMVLGFAGVGFMAYRQPAGTTRSLPDQLRRKLELILHPAKRRIGSLAVLGDPP